jgi:hypothetical protein
MIDVDQASLMSVSAGDNWINPGEKVQLAVRLEKMRISNKAPGVAVIIDPSSIAS